MRIGIDIRALAAGRRTGVEEYMIGLLHELFRQSPEDEFILFFNAWNTVRPDLSWTEGFSHVTVRRFRIPNVLLNGSLWYLHWPKLDRLIGGVEVFFMPNLNFASVSRKCQLIVTAHDLSFEYFPQLFSWKQRLWHFAIHFRALLRRANRVVAVSESTADDLHVTYGIPLEKIRCIPSGVDKRFVPMDRNDLTLRRVQEKYQLPYRFILSLGTLEPRKNVESIVRAYEVYRRNAIGEGMKYDLVIAGRPGWKYQKLFQLIRLSPVRDHIHMIGYVENEDKPALYNLASVFVYPSLYEGFGFPPLEALACGIPVIASHSASLPEVVGSAGILIDPYRPDEILQALRSLTTDKDFRQTLVERARKQRDQFTWQASAEAFQKLLAELKKEKFPCE